MTCDKKKRIISVVLAADAFLKGGASSFEAHDLSVDTFRPDTFSAEIKDKDKGHGFPGAGPASLEAISL